MRIAIFRVKYRAGTARSTLPDVQNLLVIGIRRSAREPPRDHQSGWKSASTLPYPNRSRMGRRKPRTDLASLSKRRREGHIRTASKPAAAR